MNHGFCTNLPSRCSKAAARELIEMNTQGARCPECGATLTPQKSSQRSGAGLIVAGVIALLVLAAVGIVLFKFVGKSSSGASPTVAVNTNAATAPTVAAPAPAPTAGDAPFMTFSGSNTIGDKLAPQLAEGWLKSVGGSATSIESAGNDETLVHATLAGKTVSIRVKAHGSGDAFKDLESGAADVGLASRAIKPDEAQRLSPQGDMTGRGSEHVLALDGVAVIVSPGNPLESLKKSQIAQVFTGAVTDWSQLGGNPGRIKIYARNDNSGTYDTFKSLVMGGAALAGSAQRFEDSKQLEQSVAQDPLGIGFVGLPFVKTAKALAVADGAGLPLAPTGFTVRREDYPLSRRLFLYIPATPRNPRVTEFVNFALSPAGQQIVRAAGFFDLDLNKPADAAAAPKPVDTSRCRLSEAWHGDREEYCRLNQAAQVLETNFRFKTGSYDLDNRAFRDLRRVLEWLEKNPGKQVILVGFADAQGAYASNVALSNKRAATVADALKTLGVPGTSIALQGFGPELPVADNSADAGREKNRRVEIFAR